MKTLKSFFQQSLTNQIEQAAFQNDKKTMVGLIYLIVFITSMIGGSVMYFYDMNSYLSLFMLGFVCVFGLILNRAGHAGSSAVILIAALLIVIQFNIFAGYGIHDVTIIAWPAFIFFSGLLFGWRVIPYVTTIIMGLAVVTKAISKDQFFSDYSDTGDLIVMLLILLAFSIIAISLLRGNEHLIQHLQQSDERFKAIYNSINDAIFIHDAQTGAILDVNEKMLEMFGYNRREAILLDVLAISSGIPPYAQVDALEWFKKTTSQGAQHFDWRAKDKSGRLFWVDVNMKCATIAGHAQILVSVRDITERKQADEELLKFKLGIERSEDAIFITDPQGVIVYTNPGFERIYGFNQSEAVERTPQILKSGVVPPEQYQQFWATLLNKDIVAREIINKTKDGRLIAIEGSNNPILDAAGNIIGFLGVHRDITERKRAEEQVRNNERRFHALIEHGRDNISLLAADGTLLWESPSGYSTLGYAPNQFVGHNIFELIHPDDQAWTSNIYAQVVQSPGNIQEGVFRLLHADGTWRWIECSATNLLNEPSVQAIVINYRDITARKRGDEALRESEERYHAIIDQATEGIALYSFGTKQVIKVNPAYQKLLGYTAEEMGALTLYDIVAHEGTSVDRFVERIQNEKRVWIGERKHRRKDGSLVDVEASSNLISFGGEQAMAVVIRDITERKRAEQALQESEKKYRELFQVNKDGIAIFLLNPHGPPSTFVELNNAAPAMLGYTRDEMLKLTPMMLEPHTTREQLQFRQSEFESKGVANFETVLLHKNGHPVFAEFTAQMIQYEDQPAIMNIVRDITDRKQHENELQAIASLSAALRTAPTRAEMLPVIVEQLSSLLNFDAVSAEIIDPITNESVVEAAFGAWTSIIGFRQPPGTGLNAIISKTRRPHHNNSVKHSSRIGVSDYSMDNILASAGVPLIAQDQVIGFLWIGHSKEIAENEVRLLAAVADIAANAIHRATLHEQTQKDAADLVRAYDSTLEGWAHALELRDQETEGHTRRVVQMTVDLARAMGIGENELENVRRGALLHDIGKMGIPDSVLLKPGTLNEREWEIMRRHPEYAYKLLEPIEYLHPVLDIPYNHHEKWDGTGYPRGLKGDEIPLEARIFAIVDVWDALTSDRPYRKAWSTEKALAYIAKQSNRLFDPKIVEAFLKMI